MPKNPVLKINYLRYKDDMPSCKKTAQKCTPEDARL